MKQINSFKGYTIKDDDIDKVLYIIVKAEVNWFRLKVKEQRFAICLN